MKRVTVPVPSAPVLIGLVFAFLSALFTGSFISSAATPASTQAVPSSVITGCVGSSNSGNSVLNLSGRAITASTLVRIDPSGTCAANENALTWNAQGAESVFNHTIVVTATDDNIDNGNRLLSAMTTISNAVPTSQHPYMLELEPGSYDLGSNSLNLVRFMTLKGAGENKTNIISAIASNSPSTSGVINITADTIVKDLSVLGMSDGNSNYVTVLYANFNYVNTGVTSTAIIDHVTVLPILGGKVETYGLYAGSTTDIKVQDSSILAELNGNQNSSIYGIDSHGKLTVQNSTVGGLIANNYSNVKIYGIRAAEGTLTITQSTLFASNGSAINHALDAGGNAAVSVKTSTLSAISNQANTNTALYNSSSAAVTFENGALTTSSTNVSATNNAFENSGNLRIGASQVGGSFFNSGSLKCANAYNADFTMLTADCYS